jgi:hypothetical protein
MGVSLRNKCGGRGIEGFFDVLGLGVFTGLVLDRFDGLFGMLIAGDSGGG